MLSLRELQNEFGAAVLRGDLNACGWISENGIAARDRLQIYRNNAQFAFIGTLRATYPLIEKLGGGDWFQQTALRYWRQFPSQSGDLQYVGSHFAEFLASELAATEFTYFTDVAHLEWAYQEVLTAADSAPFDIAQLVPIDANEYPRILFTVRPCVRIVSSRFPLLAIWQAHQTAVDAAATVNLDSGPSHVLVLRRDDHIELRELSASQCALLTAFTEGQTLGNAVDRALAAHENFDLGAALQQLFALQTIAACRLETDMNNNTTHLEQSP